MQSLGLHASDDKQTGEAPGDVTPLDPSDDAVEKHTIDAEAKTSSLNESLEV